MRLETRELRILAAIVESGGFKRAAAELNISQSAVSQALANLEHKLDQRLLQRSPFRLTDAGKRLLTYAQHQAREEAQLLGDLRDIRRGHTARLSLAVNSAINRYHAPELLLKFCALNPYARLGIQELPSRQVIQAVVAGTVELGMGPFQTHMPAVECVPLYDEVRSLVIADHYAEAAGMGDEPLEALSQMALLASYLEDIDGRPSGGRLRDFFRAVWEVRPIGLRLELLAAGHAVGYVGDQILAQEPLCGHLVEVAGLPFSRIPRGVGLFYRKDAVLSAGARQFITLCREKWS